MVVTVHSVRTFESGETKVTTSPVARFPIEPDPFPLLGLAMALMLSVIDGGVHGLVGDRLVDDAARLKRELRSRGDASGLDLRRRDDDELGARRRLGVSGADEPPPLSQRGDPLAADRGLFEGRVLDEVLEGEPADVLVEKNRHARDDLREHADHRLRQERDSLPDR
jgi:hypothetical protein